MVVTAGKRLKAQYSVFGCHYLSGNSGCIGMAGILTLNIFPHLGTLSIIQRPGHHLEILYCITPPPNAFRLLRLPTCPPEAW